VGAARPAEAGLVDACGVVIAALDLAMHPFENAPAEPAMMGKEPMPTIAWFYGIMIQMYYDDHNPPHFHARYGRAKAIVRLSDGETIAGELPPTATRMVRQWALARNAELQDNWQRARAHLPLEKIAGPDADE
jgi:hypothetical protein